MADFIQNGGVNGGTYASHFSAILTVWEIKTNEENNTSDVGYELKLKSGSSGRFSDLSATFSVTIDGVTVNSGSGRYNSQNYNSTQMICKGASTVPHNSDGTKTVNCKASLDFQNHNASPGDFSLNGNLTLTSLHSNPTFTRNPSVNSSFLTSISFNCGHAEPASEMYYSLDNKNWTYILTENTTIKNLSPNKDYTIYVQARNANNQSFRTTKSITAKTKDIARISSVSNFEHGSNATVSITNPANIAITLVMKIGDTQILSKTAQTGTNIISFTDTQLDTIYKKYKNLSSVTATFIVSGSGYSNSKTCTITLKGNQKTARTNVSSSWKRGKVWTNVNGTWRKAVFWTNINGTWRRGI